MDFENAFPTFENAFPRISKIVGNAFPTFSQEAQLSGERVRLGCKGVRDRFLVEDKKYSYSPLNISELCFLKCEFEHDDHLNFNSQNKK